LPATPQAVALYLAELVEKQKVAPCAGASLRTARHHKLYGLPSPTADPIVREIFKLKDRDGS